MIFDKMLKYFEKYDDEFIAQATDSTRRSAIIRRLNIGRLIGLLGIILMVASMLGEKFFAKQPDKGSGLSFFAIFFVVWYLYVDAKILALKLFSKLSSNSSVLPSAGKSGGHSSP